MILIEFFFWMSVSLIIYSYVLYPLLLMLITHLTPRPVFKKTEDCPKVSIIIAAYNEEKVIRSRIENCLSLNYPADRLEVIIASDGSDDRTAEIVRDYAGKKIVLLDFKDRRGKVNVLNEAVPLATGEIIVFSDANTAFDREALIKLVCFFGDPVVGAVCGSLHFGSAEGSRTGELEGVYWRYESMLKRLEGRRGALLGANGGIYAIRKVLYHACPPDTIIEDFMIPMMILKNGYKVVYAGEASATEEAAKHIGQEKQRRIRIGAGDFQAFFRLTGMLNPFRGFPALAFFSHKVLRWFAPFFLITAFITNLFLLGRSPYHILFLLQGVLYTCAFIGQVLNWFGMNIKIFSICYYFVSMNLALLLGFARYFSGRQQVTWKRTDR